MANLNGFNPAEFADEDSFDPIPAGDYVARISDSEMRETRDGTGQYLKLTWEVIEGQHKGRLVWENLNLVNRNPTAAGIARKTLARICKACGLNRPVQDSSELHGKPVKIKVVVRPASGQYSASNDVRGHSQVVQGPAASTAATATFQASEYAPPAWERPNQTDVPF